MKNKRNILRMGTLIIILMFLLLPMMSSPVAAEQDFDIVVDTNVTGAGVPIVTLISPAEGEYNYYHSNSPEQVNFYVTGTLSDSRAIKNSLHKVDLFVTQTEPSGSSSDSDSTGWVELEGSDPDYDYELLVIMYYVENTHYEWEVTVTAYAEDVGFTPPDFDQDSWDWTVTMD